MRAKEYLDLANNMHLFDDGTLESLRSARSHECTTAHAPYTLLVAKGRGSAPSRVLVCAALRSRRRIERHAKDTRACVRASVPQLKPHGSQRHGSGKARHTIVAADGVSR